MHIVLYRYILYRIRTAVLIEDSCAISIQNVSISHYVHLNKSAVLKYIKICVKAHSTKSNTYFEVKKTILIDDPCTNPLYHKNGLKDISEPCKPTNNFSRGSKVFAPNNGIPMLFALTHFARIRT